MSNGDSGAKYPAEEWLRQAGGGSWQQLQKIMETPSKEELERRKTEAEEQRLYYQNLTYEAFSTPAGRLWLIEYLKHVTIDQPCYVLGQDPSLGWIREGQNTIYRYIRDCIRDVEAGSKEAARRKRSRPKPVPL